MLRLRRDEPVRHGVRKRSSRRRTDPSAGRAPRWWCGAVPVGAVSRIFRSLSRCCASRAPLAPFTLPVVWVLGRAGPEEVRSYPGWQGRRQSLPSGVRLAPRARVLRHLAPRAASDHFALCLREAAREPRVTSGIN